MPGAKVHASVSMSPASLAAQKRATASSTEPIMHDPIHASLLRELRLWRDLLSAVRVPPGPPWPRRRARPEGTEIPAGHCPRRVPLGSCGAHPAWRTDLPFISQRAKPQSLKRAGRDRRAAAAVRTIYAKAAAEYGGGRAQKPFQRETLSGAGRLGKAPAGASGHGQEARDCGVLDSVIGARLVRS